MKMRDSVMWPVENPPEPASALSSQVWTLAVSKGEFTMGCYSLNSFQLLPKCSVGVIALLCDDSVFENMQSQNPGSGLGF